MFNKRKAMVGWMVYTAAKPFLKRALRSKAKGAVPGTRESSKAPNNAAVLAAIAAAVAGVVVMMLRERRALLALAAVFLLTIWRRRALPRSPWFYRAVIAAGPLAVIALEAGWTATEVGRQPWISYEVMRTSQAVTSASNLPIAYAFLVAVYVTLTAIVVWLLRRLARRPPDVEVGEDLALAARN
jgi:cytochrome bd-type quinol oxidase subunit 1